VSATVQSAGDDERDVIFRDARAGDSPAIAKVLQDSIRELCVADHRNAERPLQAWLSNKTPESVLQWVRDPGNIILVAEDGGRIAAVGGLRKDGNVILNYVAPSFRFQGLSKGMMAELERRAAQLGVHTVYLDSTVTARGFYLSLGYQDATDSGARRGLTSYPMRKAFGRLYETPE
jgi:GNAT superfamily N-acetyltransferase